MARILWVSDAGRPTGFGTVTHALAERLCGMGHDIHVLAIGWDAKYPVPGPLKLYRAEAGPARNRLGLDRSVELVRLLEPDLVVLNEDAPMMARRLFDNRFDPDKVLLNSQPIVAYMPIDGTGIPPAWLDLTKLISVVPYTRFGARQLELPEDSAVPHGIDPVWRPYSTTERRQVRERLGIPLDAFVIGRVDTNSGRKDWGSTWKVIDLALQRGLSEDDTVALFHTKLKEPNSGVDLEALISRGRGKFMVTNEDDWPIEAVVDLVNCFDVSLSTSRGEGWGLNLGQSLACGVPVIATDCSSIPEVVGPGGTLLPGVATMTNPYGVDLMLADTDAMADVLIDYASNRKLRETASRAGIEHVTQFDWKESAEALDVRIERRLSE